MTLHAQAQPFSIMQWPAEIGFLADAGLAPGELDRISKKATMQGVTCDRLVIAENIMPAEDYYRAMAKALGVAYLAADELAFRLSPGHLRIPETCQSGIAVLTGEGPGFVMAPEGGMIAKLLASGPSFRSRIALTHPGALLASVRARAAHVIAYRAAHALPDSMPLLSARSSASRWQIGMSGMAMLMLSFFGSLEPVATLVALGLVLGLMFLCLATIRMAGIFETDDKPPSAAHRLLQDAELPFYTVLVPLYRETEILPQLMEALRAIDYPAAKLDCKILVEADDAPLIAALGAMVLPGFAHVAIVPPGHPRTKPRALNAGLAEARGALLTIYDAEDIPDPGQLRLAATILRNSPRRMACLQARLSIDNARDNLLTRAFALEYAGLFDVINPGLVRSRLPFLLGGTSNHFRGIR